MSRQRFDILTFPVPPYHTIEREWQWAEELGFDQGWIPETWTMSDHSYLEPWTTLAALARATKSIRLGTLVAVLVSRHPTLLAGHVLTVDHASQGRVEPGIGAGDVPTDSGIFGTPQWSAGERVERLEDQLHLLDALLRGESVTSTHPHYSVAGARLPEPVQRPRPPLVVAGEGRRSLRLVARHADAWVTLGGQPQTLEHRWVSGEIASSASSTNAFGSLMIFFIGASATPLAKCSRTRNNSYGRSAERRSPR